jgi:hypothetical protein
MTTQENTTKTNGNVHVMLNVLMYIYKHDYCDA